MVVSLKPLAIALFALGLAPSALAEPLPEQPASTVGYADARAAYAALRANPAVEFTMQQGWTIATDAATNTVWSFPPQDNAAYPSVVRRQIMAGKGGAVEVQMDVLCSASKVICDDLVRSFEAMNDEASAQLHGAH